MLNRRDFLKISCAGLGTLLLPHDSEATDRASSHSVVFPMTAKQADDPHFFLQIYVYGGIDSLFLFDGRPKAMTTAGLIHDYVQEQPEPWFGDNGTHCLTTAAARMLAPHRQRLSVLNGVHMSTSFDGHLQNVNFLYTGNPFGGESFIPHLNNRETIGYERRPLDAVQQSGFALDQHNGGNSPPLSFASAYNLIQALRKAPEMKSDHPVLAKIRARAERLGQGAGMFSGGSRSFANAFAQSPDLAKRLSRLELRPPSTFTNAEHGFIEMMAGFFREGICSSALMEISARHHLDAHAASLAQLQTETYADLAEKLKRLFDLLANTEFANGKSLFDVTTVMFASEFGRTLRQPELPLDQTGTDHNSLNNSILLAGKGIRGGLVLGETDWRSNGDLLSKAHQAIDPTGLKLMGRPFDFVTGQPRTDLPPTFEADDYINMASVINTLYSRFDVPQQHWRTVKRDGPKAPVLSQLLT